MGNVGKNVREKRARDKAEKEKIANAIQEECKSQLLPNLQEKTKELSNNIISMLKENDKVSNTTILSLISRKSMSELTFGFTNLSYTKEEIMIGFNLYLDMIIKINEYKSFPATIESFCVFMGVSYDAFLSWECDIEKKPATDYIKSFVISGLATGGLTGEMKEISAMFQQKTLGKVEQVAPQMVTHKIETDISVIQEKLKDFKKDSIEATYEER